MPRLALVALLLVSTLPVWAEDPITENFFTPDLLQRNHEAIGLDEKQKADLQDEGRALMQSVADLRQQIEKAKADFVELTKGDKVDEQKVLAAAEKMMNLETPSKRAQLALLIKIKNTLTPDQQAKLREIKDKQAALRPKLQKLQELARQWQAQGGDLSTLEPLKAEYDQLVRSGKTAEAEALIDKTYKELSEKMKK